MKKLPLYTLHRVFHLRKLTTLQHVISCSDRLDDVDRDFSIMHF